MLPGALSSQEYWDKQMKTMYDNQPDMIAKRQNRAALIAKTMESLQSNQDLDVDTLIEYSKVHNAAILDLIINYPKTDEKVLMAILDDKELQNDYRDDYIFAMMLMAEKRCNANLFKHMNFGLDYRVIDIALKHNDFTEDVILSILDHLDSDNYDKQLLSIHRSGKETSAILNKYVSMHNSIVHSFIVDLPGCSPELLAYLTRNDKKLSVNKKILKHQNCNADVLFAVSEHDDCQILLLVIQHPKCPTSLLLSIKEKDQMKPFVNSDIYELIYNHFEDNNEPMPMKLAYEIYLKSGCSLGAVVDKFVAYYNEDPNTTIEFLEDISMSPDLVTGGKTRDFLEYFLRIKPEVEPHVHLVRHSKSYSVY